MSLLQAIIMGIIQGATEFLPVSSSGHLALFKILFHVNTDTGLMFDVMLHLGTLIAIFAVYYKDIIRMVVEAFKIIRDVFINIVRFFRNKFGKEENENRNQRIPEVRTVGHRIHHTYGNHRIGSFRFRGDGIGDSSDTGNLSDYYQYSFVYFRPYSRWQ